MKRRPRRRLQMPAVVLAAARAEFEPGLGSSLLKQVQSDYPINDEPGAGAPVHGTPSTMHQGSASDVGFYGIVQKDLRSALHQPVTDKLNRVYCGKGSLAKCRAALTSSLAAAVAQTPDQVYPPRGPARPATRSVTTRSSSARSGPSRSR